MGHGHDDHAHGGHGSDDHGHGHPPEPAAPPPPPAPHVFTIARGTTWIGILAWLAGAIGFLWYAWQGTWSCAAWLGALSLYGFAIWLAARDTLAQEPAASR